MKTAFIAIGLLVWAPTDALAAMAPEIYAEMLAAAPYHVQLEVTARSLIPRPPGGQEARPGADPWRGTCTLSGTVERVFRDDAHELDIGEAISVEVPCEHKGGPGLVGGVIYSEVEALAAAAYAEVVIDGPPGGPYSVAAHGKGIAILDRASEAPVIAVPR